MRNSVTFLITIAIIGFLSIGGCGGSDSFDGCEFNFNGILNGPNFDQATSEWNCGGAAEFAFYQDGTGRDFSSFITYQRTDCRMVAFQEDGVIEGVYDNLEGSRSSGFLSFTRIVEDSEILLNCTLGIIE